MTDFEIPTLRNDRLSTAIPSMVYAGGAVTDARHPLFLFRTASLKKARGAVVGFYVDDERLECLWRNPRQYSDLFLRHGVLAVVEPDFSLWTDALFVEQLWSVYRMRSL